MYGGLIIPISTSLHLNLQVAGEKQVLRHYLEHCRIAIQMLEMNVEDDVAYAEKVSVICN